MSEARANSARHRVPQTAKSLKVTKCKKKIWAFVLRLSELVSICNGAKSDGTYVKGVNGQNGHI